LYTSIFIKQVFSGSAMLNEKAFPSNQVTSDSVMFGDGRDWTFSTPSPEVAEETLITSKCDYCGSRCTDSRGNCGACGAPK